MVDVNLGPGEAASGFGCWGGAVGAVVYFAGVRVRFGKHVGGWFRAAFSLLVAMCPFGMPLVERIWIRAV